MSWIDHDDYLDSRAQHEAEREEWEASQRPDPEPHDPGRCDCDTCAEDRYELRWGSGPAGRPLPTLRKQQR